MLVHQAALQPPASDPFVTAIRLPSRAILQILDQYYNEVSLLCQTVNVAPPQVPVWTSELNSILQALNQEFQQASDRLQEHILGQAHSFSIGVRITKQPLTMHQVHNRLQEQLIPLTTLYSTLSALMK